MIASFSASAKAVASSKITTWLFYVMMNIRGITGKRCHGKVLSGSTAIAEALLEHAHVALVPGAAFLDEGFCRISYATSMENIEEGLRRIAAFVKELE